MFHGKKGKSMNGKPKLKLREGGHYLRKDGQIVVASIVREGVFRMGEWCYYPDGELCGLGWNHQESLVKEVSRLAMRRPSTCLPLEEW